MKVPALDLKRVHKEIEAELLSVAERVIRSGRYILGDEVRRFERSLEELMGVKRCIAVNSGTDALTLALMVTGIGRDCEVITTPFSFFATVEAILAVGAKPVFVDIEPDTYSLNPALLERAVTNKTSVILPVHLYGHPADMEQICQQATMLNNVFVVEDCAQAMGARIGDRPVGTFGEFACFSFYPTKNVGALGDAGCILTGFDNYGHALTRLRNHGQVGRYDHATRGLNSRMDELQAGFLNAKLTMLDKWNEQRRTLADNYTRMIKDTIGDLVIPPTQREGFHHVYHQYTIRVPNRDKILQSLLDRGVEAIVHYPRPLHLMEPLRFLGYREGAFPEAERAGAEVLSLPIFPGLTEDEQSYVVAKLKDALEG